MPTRIIDSHVHFWNPSHFRYQWLDKIEALNRTFLPEDLPLQHKGWQMHKLVFVQAGCLPGQSLAEAQWIAALAQNDARVQAVVAFAPVEQGRSAQALIEQLAAMPLVKGIRRNLQSEPPGFGLQTSFIDGVRLLAPYDLSFDICVQQHQLPDVIQLVQQCPNISFVLDHFGKPDIASGAVDSWAAHISTLAKFDNLHCKLSGLVTEAHHQQWTLGDLQPYINHVLETFGPARLMFGGDWPVVTLASSYPRWIQTALDSTIDLSDAEKAHVFYETAAAFYRL